MATTKKKAESLLGNYRVLDLSDEMGHLCGRLLGDWGADVVKVEPPGGDPARNTGPFYHDTPHPEKSLYWLFTNANKRGVTLNLEKAKGRELFQKLVERTDLIIESFAPGYMDSLGLGYSALSQLNPRVVLTSITPFGQTGPYAHYKATDLILISMGGMASLFGDADRPPVRISYPQAYFLGSLHAATGSMVALYHQEFSGHGQQVDVSIQEAVALSLMNAAEIWDLLRQNYRRSGPYSETARPDPPGPARHRRIFPCRDGYVVLFLSGGASPGGVKSSQELVAWANQEGFALELKDYGWRQYNMATITQAGQDSLEAPIAAFLLTKTKVELLEMAAQKSILMAPVFTIRELPQNSQLDARKFWVEVPHPELGENIPFPGASVKLSECPWRVFHRAPLLGEHNEEIYRKELALSSTTLARLRKEGVI